MHTLAWAPQGDLLSQPGVKAFVTHAGQNSVSEAGWQGVPMVCLPQSADQLDNCAKVRTALPALADPPRPHCCAPNGQRGMGRGSPLLGLVSME